MKTENMKSFMDILPQAKEAGVEKIANTRKASDRLPAGLAWEVERSDGFQKRLERKLMEEKRTDEMPTRLEDAPNRADGTRNASEGVAARVEDLPRYDETTRNDTVAQANRDANVKDVESLKETTDSMDKVDKAIQAKIRKIQSLLEKLGLTVTPEALQDPGFLKKALAIVGRFLDDVKESVGQVDVKAAVTEVAQTVADALGIKIDLSKESIPALFSDLKNELTQLSALLELKDFVNKSVATGENQDVLVAEALKGLEVPAETPAETPIETPTETTVETPEVNTASVAVKGTSETAAVTEGAPLGVAQAVEVKADASTGAAIAAEVKPEATQAMLTDEAAPESDQAKSAEDTKNTKDSKDTKNTEPVAAQTDPKAEAKAALIETLLKAGLLTPEEKNSEVKAPDKVSDAKIDTKITAVIAETVVKAVLAVEPVKTEKTEKLSVSLEALKEDKTTVKVNLTNFANQQKGGENQAEPEAQKAAVPVPAQAVTPEAAPEKSLFVKAMTELKEAITNAVTAPKAAGSAPAAELAGTHRFSYLTNDRPIPEKAVLHQIVSKFQMLHGAGTTEMRLQLKPEHLGSIKVSLEVDQNVVFTRMQVESEKVKQIIENNVQTLKNALEESGIKIERFEVTVGSDRDDLYKRHELSEQGRHVRGMIRTQFGADGMEGEVPDTETGRRMGYNTIELLA
ncbi:MAG: flagellar hook-length control protein FliK [Fibrobacterota bacterium]